MIRVAFDLDDTLLQWRKSHEQKFNCCLDNLSNDVITKQVEQCKYDKEFWSNLDLLEKPDFEPWIYCTKRISSKVYTRINLQKVGLPIKPIYQLYSQEDNKARIIKGRCDLLIDDSWFNVQQCLSVGFPALLITREHNLKIETKYRIYKLSYTEICEKYNELFR